MTFIAGVVAALVAIAGLAVLTAYLMSRFIIHAEMKRRAERFEPRQADAFATSEARGGVRRVVLQADQTLAAMIGGRLSQAGIAHEIDVSDGGGEARGTAASTYTLMFQAADEVVVAEVLADVDARQRGADPAD